MAKEKNDDPTQEARSGQGQAQRARSVKIDETNAISHYTNFCRVTGSPEELIVDFGLNSQPLGANDEAIKVNQRIIMNFYTAKRLLSAIHAAVQRHESVFGVLETDIQKRVKVEPKKEG